jgi:hypothetical protein
MRLASIHTYPVKSCRRLDHDTVAVEPWGLAGDRRWLVVDQDGRCVTQREVAAMTRIQPVLRPEGGVALRAASAPDLPVPEPSGIPVEVRVHRTAVYATPAGEPAHEWLTAVLDQKVRLVWLDDPTRRPVDPDYGRPDDRVSFADAYPLLLTNTASLDALNGWLLEEGSPEGPLPMNRFRPNVVVSGAGAWTEDGWLGRRLRIGAVTFRVVKPCDRCVMTTTDQETGERGKEPLRVLGKYRNVNQKLLFGVNLIPDPPYGEISTGDPVAIIG